MKDKKQLVCAAHVRHLVSIIAAYPMPIASTEILTAQKHLHKFSNVGLWDGTVSIKLRTKMLHETRDLMSLYLTCNCMARI